MKKMRFFMMLLRMAIGWYFLYQGIVALTTPGWSVLSRIVNAHTFPNFYSFISQTAYIGYLSYLVIGLLMLSGVLLITGIATRIGAFLGILTMLFFYFPLLSYPKVGTSYYIIDEHILISLILVYYLFAHPKEHPSFLSFFRRSRYH